MTKTYRKKGIASLLIAAFALSACGASKQATARMEDRPIREGDHFQVDLVSASNRQLHASGIRTQTRVPGGVHDATRLETGRSTEGQMLVGLTSGMGAAAIGAVGGIIAADRKKPGGGVSIGVQGGTAQAVSHSDADAAAGLNASGMPIFTGCTGTC